MSAVWGITCYFNPGRYRRRLENYREFRARLAVPLVTVELSDATGFALQDGDAEILIQHRSSDCLWQKERLLNLAIEAVPAACDKIAWIDCDVLFDREDWPDLAARALDDFGLVHLFEQRLNLMPGTTAPGPDCHPVVSGISKMASGRAQPDDFRRAGAPVDRGSTLGLAWASRREIIASHGLYDACIIGSGDRAITCAALGRFDYGLEALCLQGRQIDHYLDWARPFHESIGGKVGHIPGRACHLWHGHLQHRRYEERLTGLRAFHFDPYVDIAIDEAGCWRWDTDKPELHQYVARYFASRAEDG